MSTEKSIEKPFVIKTHQDRIRYLISRLYEPGDINNFDVKLSTGSIYNNLCSIIPANAFDEFDVIDALEELKFEPQYEKKKEIITDENGNTTVKEYDDLTYLWYLKKKS